MMNAALDRAAENFLSVLSEESLSKGDHPHSLAELLEVWLENYGGMTAVGGDYTNYLQTVLYVLHRYLKDPDEFRHRLTGVYEEFGGQIYTSGDLDPESFKCAVYEHMQSLHTRT